MTIKEYANSRGIAYESVRKQVNRYKDELANHTHKNGKRGTELDDDAIAFLDEHRENRTVIVQSQSTQEYNEQIIKLQNEIISLYKEMSVRPRLEDFEQTKEQLAKTEKEFNELRQKLDCHPIARWIISRGEN